MSKRTTRGARRGMPTGLNLLLATLPPGRRRVAMALLADPAGRTYRAVAAQLGVHLGTVHQHLRRIRQRHPEVHAAVIKERQRQLAARHRKALARAKAHSQLWHKMTRGRYLYDFGGSRSRTFSRFRNQQSSRRLRPFRKGK